MTRYAEDALAACMQAQVLQAHDSVTFGGGITMQQHIAVGVLDQHGLALARPPAALALIVKTQLRLHQALLRMFRQRYGREVQAGRGLDALQLG